MGHVRFWNLTPPLANITLELINAASTDGHALNTAGPANYYANYINVPPGTYALRVFRQGDRLTVIKSFNLAVRDRSYFTFLATAMPDGKPTVELIDDTPDPTKPPENRLTVRQYCPDSTVVITAGTNYKTDALAYGMTQTITGLPDGTVPLKMHAVKTGTTAVRTWDTQADFRSAHHATLFVINDLYGRIRARAAIDGPSPADEAEAAAAAKSTP